MSTRRQVQFMVLMTLLAWATQTLFTQWGYGAVITGAFTGGTTGALILPEAKPANAGVPMVRLELRSEVRPEAGDVTLKDVCRWSADDGWLIERYGDAVVARMGEGPEVRRVRVGEIRAALQDAGANLAAVEFSGAATCAIATGGAEIEAEVAIVEASDAPAVETSIETPKREPSQVVATPKAPVPVYEDQLVVTRALSRGQAIIKSDLRSDRVLVEARRPAPVKDAPATDARITDASEAIGQLAARDLKAGDVLMPNDLAAPALVGKGDFITVSVIVGTAQVETVARALEGGARGEVIRATNEATKDVYRVVVTGASMGDVIP
ncbi:MAG: flagellar basal body P-ring formation chaperone FlgA [Tepidisphaeraceae bacterium]